jgi:hypothetical protein
LPNKIKSGFIFGGKPINKKVQKILIIKGKNVVSLTRKQVEKGRTHSPLPLSFHSGNKKNATHTLALTHWATHLFSFLGKPLSNSTAPQS